VSGRFSSFLRPISTLPRCSLSVPSMPFPATGWPEISHYRSSIWTGQAGDGGYR
jgi:hypothetical protein